jgi:hypothetical protein
VPANVEMKKRSDRPSTAFVGDALLAEGPLIDVALAAKEHLGRSQESSVLVFDDATGEVIDLDLRGGDSEVRERIDRFADAEPAEKKPPGRGRPSLGVVAREVTLLPRHWEWLGKQRGGASATLRRLIDEARKQEGHDENKNVTTEASYRAMRALAGDREGFEEAARALFAADAHSFEAHTAKWPHDIQRYVRKLAGKTLKPPSPV